MDAFSTAASATALVGTCAYVARSLCDIRKKLKRIDVTISALEAECWLISSTFAQVARIIKHDTESFKSRFGVAAEDGLPIAAGLKNAIDCATMLMAQLQDSLEKWKEKNTAGAISLSSKASYLWEEGDMKAILETVRHLGQEVGTLLTAMQSESLINLRDTMTANAAALQAIAGRTRESYVASVKESSQDVGPSSTSNMNDAGTASYYEEELIKSTVYKKAFRLLGTRQSIIANGDGRPIPMDLESFLRLPADSVTNNSILDSQFRKSVLIRNLDRLGIPMSRIMIRRLKSSIPWQPPTHSTRIDNMLQSAVKAGNFALVRANLGRGANIEAFEEKSGFRPLHIAIDNDKCDMVKLLLSNGASTASLDNYCNMALHEACAQGCITCISALISAGADINAKGENEQSPLHLAARYGHLSAVKYLLSAGADINARCLLAEELCPLSTAIRYEQRKMIELLLQDDKCKSALNDTSERELPPLTLAAMYCGTAVVKMLMDSGAGIDDGGTLKQSPIHGATRAKNKDVLMYLLKNGANRDLRTDMGYSVLHMASYYGSKAVVKYLIGTGSDLHDQDHKLQQPIHVAVLEGNRNIVELLLKSGASIDALDQDGNTPLLLAAMGNRPSIVELLLTNKANIEASSTSSRRPLDMAAESNALSAAEVLLKYGASLKAQEHAGWTPLHHACTSEGGIEMMQLLVAHGAQVNVATIDGEHPIHIAVSYGRLSMVRFLLNQCVDVHVRDRGGFSPIHRGAEKNLPHVLALLLERGAQVNMRVDSGEDSCLPIHLAAENGLAQNVRLLIDAGSEIDCRDSNEETALHLACAYGNKDTVTALLEAGASPSTLCQESATALRHAAAQGHVEFIEILKTYGSSMGDRDDQGDTHLTFLCGWRQKYRVPKYLDFAARLIDLGADMDAVGSAYYPPLHRATVEGDVEMVKILVDKGANVNARTRYGETALRLAMEIHHEELADYLMRCEYDAIHETSLHHDTNVAIEAPQKSTQKDQFDNIDATLTDVAFSTQGLQFAKSDIIDERSDMDLQEV